MCYSAQVVQDLKKLFRELNVFMDYEEAERVFLLRLDDPTVNISKGFEANFDEPSNDAERRIPAIFVESSIPVRTIEAEPLADWTSTSRVMIRAATALARTSASRCTTMPGTLMVVSP